MEIRLSNLGKRFNRDWIFRNLTLNLESGTACAVTGPNGSGKSTFLKVISGYMPPTTGEVAFFKDNKVLDQDYWYRNIAFAAPYLELIEEFTLNEFLNFHFKFKKRRDDLTNEAIVQRIGLDAASNKFISDFSSGMKQRLRLATAFFSESEIVLLDEPTVNLDEAGIRWYYETAKELTGGRILLIASNQPHEYNWIQRRISIIDFK